MSKHLRRLNHTYYKEYEDTHNIRPLYKALYQLQRTPGCEKEAKSVAQKLKNEFMKFPEQEANNISYRIVSDMKYRSNGIVHNTHKKEQMVVIPPYKATLPKRTTAKKQSFIYLKKINPIWYAQVMMYLKRSFTIHKNNKVNYQDVMEKHATYEELDTEQQEHVDYNKIIIGMKHAYANLMSMFHFQTHLVNINNREHTIPIDLHQEVSSFFFLTENECKLLAEAITNDKLGTNPYYSEDATVHTSNVLRAIITKENTDRQYITHTRKKDVYGYRDHDDTPIHEAIWEHYKNEFQQLNKSNQNVLKRFGIHVS